jgi:putative DNA methylase
LKPEEIPEAGGSSERNVWRRNVWRLTHQLVKAMDYGGNKACAKLVIAVNSDGIEESRTLAYRLYNICDQKKWAQLAFSYNALISSWPEIQQLILKLQKGEPQSSLF